MKARSESLARGAACILFLLLVTVAIFRDALLTTASVVVGNLLRLDISYAFYPWRFFGFSSLSKGLIPLWNPYILCGCPFAANWQSALFYPLNIIFLLLPVHMAINCSFALHIFLAALFTYFFMRYIPESRFGSLIASLTFMLSAPLILRVFAGHLSMICAIPWFPAQLLAIEAGIRTRKAGYFVLGGAALGMQVLAGHPQTVCYSVLGALLYFTARICCMTQGEKAQGSAFRLCGCLMLLLLTGFSLGAVQLLPGLEFLRHSSRGMALDISEAASNSFPPENLLTFIAPSAMGDFVNVFCWGRSYMWETAVYVGVMPLALAVISLCAGGNRFVRVLSAVAAVSFVLALGGYTPLYRALYYRMPGFSLLRGSAKILFLPVFCLAALAGIGAGSLISGAPRQGQCVRRVAFATGAAVALLLALYMAGIARGGERAVIWRLLLDHRKAMEGYWRVLDDPRFVARAYLMFRSDFVRLIVLLALTTAVLAACTKRGRAFAWCCALVIALVTADLWSFDAPFLAVSPVSYCWWPPDIASFFENDRSMFRILKDSRVASAGVNQGMNNGFFTVDGYEATLVNEFKELADATGISGDGAERAACDARVSPLMAMMNLKYLMLPAGARLGDGEYSLRFDSGGVMIYERRNLLPRAYIVHGAKVIENDSAALDYMTGGGFRPDAQVVLEEAPAFSLPEAGIASGNETAEIVHETPSEVAVRCRLETAGILFLSDTFFPGWNVTVDRAPGRILRANHAFRGVPLDAGTHEVAFFYRPASFRYGAVVSVMAGIFVLRTLSAMLWNIRGKTRRANGILCRS